MQDNIRTVQCDIVDLRASPVEKIRLFSKLGTRWLNLQVNTTDLRENNLKLIMTASFITRYIASDNDKRVNQP